MTYTEVHTGKAIILGDIPKPPFKIGRASIKDLPRGVLLLLNTESQLPIVYHQPVHWNTIKSQSKKSHYSSASQSEFKKQRHLGSDASATRVLCCRIRSSFSKSWMPIKFIHQHRNIWLYQWAFNYHFCHIWGCTGYQCQHTLGQVLLGSSHSCGHPYMPLSQELRAPEWSVHLKSTVPGTNRAPPLPLPPLNHQLIHGTCEIYVTDCHHQSRLPTRVRTEE